MQIKIRKASITDLDTVVAFVSAMARETEGKALAPETLTAGVRAVFEDPTKGTYLIAESDGEPVGGLLITTEWSDWRNAHYWWIQSVFVSPGHRGKGVYRALHRHVETMARSEKGVCGLRLYVDTHNQTAKTVYERLGMALSGYELYEVSDMSRGDARHDG
ncbi:MAG: GNAT family N-acetyltransferase [Candidatus Latescibacterota bacterium]|nr:MAG: GNAT family N-acetyltransferase [Candidatus Latescibacterota bacterium]